MSDNVVLPGTGDTVAADIIGGVKYQRVKNAFGGDGVATDVSQADPLPVTQEAALLAVTSTAAAAAAATLTLPAAGAGLFIYLVALEISLYSNAARTGAAAPWIVTSTGIQGNPSWDFSKAGAIGAIERYVSNFAAPIKGSAANTAMVFSAPAATGGLWRLTGFYFTGP